MRHIITKSITTRKGNSINKAIPAITHGNAMSGSKPLYENQVAGARDIIEVFDKPNCCWVVVAALMQSGKSDTYMMVGAELLRLGKVSSVVIISANSDVVLKNQTKDTKQFWRAYRKYLGFNGILSADDAADFVDDAKDLVSVIWGTELKTETKILNNALIIWDESHYGQSNQQMVDEWFRVQGISPDGSGCANGNIVLSVSATPFSECIDIGKHCQTKKVVHLSPGPSYWGVDDMMENDVILPFVVKLLPTMLGELKDARADGRNAAIIRLSGKQAALESSIRRHCAKKQILCQDMNAGSDEKDINALLSSTDEPMVVLIKGMLRMGKRIERKDRLLWCLETSTDPNHDTTLQGLLGRCCGYIEGGSGPDIKVYLSPIQVQNLKAWGTDKAGKAMNVKRVGRTRRNPEKAGYPTVPLRVFLAPKPANTPKKASIPDILNALIVERGNDKTANYARNILASGATSKVDFNSLEKDTYKGVSKRLGDSYSAKKPFNEPKMSCGCKLDQIRVWYSGKTVYGGYVYVQYKTNIKPENYDSLMMVGNTTGREIFAHKHEDGTEHEQNGSAKFKIGPETADDVEAMKVAIQDIIVWFREFRSEHVTAGQGITSDCDGYSFNGILVSPEVHAALKPGGSIYEHIKVNHRLLLELVPGKGRPPKDLPAGYKRLATIKWV